MHAKTIMHASTASEHYIFGGGADDLHYSWVRKVDKGGGAVSCN